MFSDKPTGAPLLGHSETPSSGGHLYAYSTTPTQGPMLGQTSTMSQAPGIVTSQTNAPSLCVDRWSNWINKDTPTTGDGDREMLTASELQQFCGSGKIKAIECETTTGIASYSTGEIAMCTIEGGSVCLNADNYPMPCSDYKIRYLCECNGMYRYSNFPTVSDMLNFCSCLLTLCSKRLSKANYEDKPWRLLAE